MIKEKNRNRDKIQDIQVENQLKLSNRIPDHKRNQLLIQDSILTRIN